MMQTRGPCPRGTQTRNNVTEHVISPRGSAMRILLAFLYNSFFSSDVDTARISAPNFSSDDVSGSDDIGTSFASNALT